MTTLPSAFAALPMGALHPKERDILRLRLDDLLRFLGAPGDWGYDTKLSALTIVCRDLRAAIDDDGAWS